MSDVPLLPPPGGMSNQEIVESQSHIAEEEPEKFKGWETGYRGWRLRFREGKPRLGAVTRDAIWEPGEGGEVSSDWSPADGPFEETSKGLYFLKSLGDVKQHYPREDVYGAVTPYETYEEGSIGFRTHKAMVRSLFSSKEMSCFVCRMPAKYIVHNDQRFILCKGCLSKVEKLVAKQGYTEEDIDGLLVALAEAYETEVVDTPEELR